MVWTKGTIRAILNNPLYRGTLIYGKARYSEIGKKRGKVSQPPSERIVVAGTVRHGRREAAEVLADDGVSGGRRERLDRLAERVKATGARAIVVYHLDRFDRDLAATLDYLRWFARRGVELHVVGRGRVEADTATGFIVTAVEGLAAEHYRRVISEKTRDALARLRAKGRRVSRWAPYGWRFGPGGRLVVNRGEASAVDRIGELAATGLSLREISRVLATEGILARNGRPLAPMTLSRLITRRPTCSPPKISEVGA